jgi:hypothetical protein
VLRKQTLVRRETAGDGRKLAFDDFEVHFHCH